MLGLGACTRRPPEGVREGMGYGRESILERPGMLMGCFGVLSAMIATDPNIDFFVSSREQSGVVLRQGGNWPRLINHPEVDTGHGYSVNALVCTSLDGTIE